MTKFPLCYPRQALLLLAALGCFITGCAGTIGLTKHFKPMPCPHAEVADLQGPEQDFVPPTPPPISEEAMLSDSAPRIWPVMDPSREFISWFGPRNIGNGGTRFHKGLDIKADYGVPVYATAPGEVTFSGDMRGYGKFVLINHGEGFESAYGHLKTCEVEVGDTVYRGQQIGLLGQSGNATTRHVHYEVRLNGEFYDPLFFLPAE